MVKKNERFFLKSLNDFHPYIKFTYESNRESVAFLDIKVSLRTKKVLTGLYVKSTNRHQYQRYFLSSSISH